MTMSEKILAKACQKNSIKAGEIIWAKVDILMTHDPCSPGVISIFKKEFGDQAKIWDKKKHIMIPDHFIFTSDEKANANIRMMRNFAQEQGHKYFYDPHGQNYKGVCHIALAQEGHNRPGEVLVGTDSHTVTSGAFGTFAIGVGNTDAAFALGTGEILLRVPETIKVVFHGQLPPNIMAKDLILLLLRDLTTQGATYQSIEFSGEVIDNMKIEDRMTLCNMVIEAGAKNGIIVPNANTLDYINARSDIKNFEIMEPDKSATYTKVLEYDLTNMKPQIAKPHSPDNVDDINNIEGEKIDRAYIGSCTGGKSSDFYAAAQILKNQQVSIETFGVPATREVFYEIINQKIGSLSVYEILVNAGVHMTTEPSCAACCGGPIDTFGRVNGEMSVISTTNRNFSGRMGAKSAKIYLASPFSVASTAITGYITNPQVFLKN
uniref:3-isopropylmalate dehydratase large subunit n=1 Tax=Leiomenia cribrosa TaxID=217483 RepID=A0A4D6WY56_9FLOR|nr:3-isopropylmalate dehydratase large subunit [Leiomenia cribrosa]